jgi:hypothetical protein
MAFNRRERMTSIYDLKTEQNDLLDRIFWVEEGEEERDIIEKKLLLIEGSVERKLSFLTSVLAESIALSSIATERKRIALERLERKEKQAKRAEEKLRQFILQTMTDFGLTKVEGEILNVSRYERDSVIQLPDFNIDKLPLNLIKVTKAIDKTEINNLIKSGGHVSGFELVKKDCLRIS